MSSTAELDSDLEARPWWQLGPAGGQIAGWSVLAVVNAIVIAVAARKWHETGRLRALHHVYDAAELVAFGVVSAFALLAWRRVRGWLRLRSARQIAAANNLALALPLAALAAVMLPGDLRGLAGTLSGKAPPWVLTLVLVVLVVVVAGCVPLTLIVAARARRGFLRLLPIGVSVVVGIENHSIASHDYSGIHFFVAWCAALAIGVAVSTQELGPARAWRSALLAVPALASLWCFVFPPSNAVRLALFRQSGSALAPWLARVESTMAPSQAVVVAPESVRWFQNRNDAPAVPSSRQLAPNAIVLLLVVDAGRRDLLDAPHEADFPNLMRLKHQSVDFENARSAASGTTLAITSLLTGRYPMQIRWADMHGRDYPHLDESVRFTEILAKSGVDTLSIQGLPGLGAEYGIVRGFAEEQILHVPGAFADSRQMIPALMKRLEGAGDRPLFAYLHFNDAHAPYDSAGKAATAFRGYITEVQQFDRELGRLLDFLREKGLDRRTSIVLTADHGEAFGEHGKFFHATTVYDELLRVPLLVHVPGVAPRRVDEPVTLVDLSSTFLDWFGCTTPGSFMGQSLAPLLAGGDQPLFRPIVAESDRGLHSMVFRDGLKLIADERLHTLELYDLKHDPGERENLADNQAALASQRLGLLATFMNVHRVPRHE